jgi:hypothetical protein
MTRKLLVVGWLAIAALFVANRASAQSQTGAIQGIVRS